MDLDDIDERIVIIERLRMVELPEKEKKKKERRGILVEQRCLLLPL